jgi:hypothetical protein
MARVAGTVMLKNEHSLMAPLLRDHAPLFGAEDLFIFHNGSTEPAVLAALAAFEHEGVHVDRSYPTEDCRQKSRPRDGIALALDEEPAREEAI